MPNQLDMSLAEIIKKKNGDKKKIKAPQKKVNIKRTSNKPAGTAKKQAIINRKQVSANARARAFNQRRGIKPSTPSNPVKRQQANKIAKKAIQRSQQNRAQAPKKGRNNKISGEKVKITVQNNPRPKTARRDSSNVRPKSKPAPRIQTQRSPKQNHPNIASRLGLKRRAIPNSQSRLSEKVARARETNRSRSASVVSQRRGIQQIQRNQPQRAPRNINNNSNNRKILNNSNTNNNRRATATEPKSKGTLNRLFSGLKMKNGNRRR